MLMYAPAFCGVTNYLHICFWLSSNLTLLSSNNALGFWIAEFLPKNPKYEFSLRYKSHNIYWGRFLHHGRTLHSTAFFKTNHNFGLPTMGDKDALFAPPVSTLYFFQWNGCLLRPQRWQICTNKLFSWNKSYKKLRTGRMILCQSY